MTYLDYNATTPVDPIVVDSMMPFFTDTFGNPSSTHHDSGRTASHAVEEARKQVADSVGMNPSDVIFTSGATEANNLALAGLRRAFTAAITHDIRDAVFPFYPLGVEYAPTILTYYSRHTTIRRVT